MSRFILLLFALLCASPALAAQLTITDPAPGWQGVAPATLVIKANVALTDDGERITSFQLGLDGVVVASRTSAGELVHTAGHLAAGTHYITARAINNVGTEFSADRVVQVFAPGAQPPVVSLGEPTGTPFIAPATVGLSANASDPDGQVIKVEFLANGAVVATDTSGPSFAGNWSNAPVGNHAMAARATDDHGNVVTSATRPLTIHQTAVTGNIERVEEVGGNYYVVGWACSTGRPAAIDVAFYVDDTNGNGAGVGHFPADLAGEAGIADSCMAPNPNHRFRIPLDSALRQAHASKKIRIHGISPTGNGALNLEIGNSRVFQVPPPLSVTRRYFYDEHQRLCRSVEPETGSTVYQYDAAGNLDWSATGLSFQASDTSCRRDEAWASGRAVRRTHDARNRLKTLRFPDGRGDQDWEYTPDGLPSVVTTVNVPGAVSPRNQYAYNRRRLLTTETQLLPAWYGYNLGYQYDANGSLKEINYPSGMTVDFAPNALGQPRQAIGHWLQNGQPTQQPFATGVTYHPNGAIATFSYGNGIVHAMAQNARQLPDEVRSTNPATGAHLHFDGYDYDANGNVAAISDGATGTGGVGDRTMAYDGLDRLTNVVSPMYAASGGEATYRYNGLDDLVEVKAPGRHHFYCYDGRRQLANVQSGHCGGGATVIGLAYDANGNVGAKNGQRFDFDHGNRLREIHTGTRGGPDHVTMERYRYDAHGRRILAVNFSQGSITSLYGNDGRLYYQENQRTGQNRAIDHIYLGGSLVAQREVPIGGTGSTFRYQHTDALGSPVVVTDQNRGIVERAQYEPYGKQLTSPDHTGNDRPGYTGHVEDRLSELTYMQQRYFDAQVGQFLSVDPVTADPARGANFNRYWYAGNNPYSLIDPDGREACGKDSTCRISSGMSAGTIAGVIASARGQTFDKNGGVIASRSVSDQQILSAAGRLPDPNRATEVKIHIAPDGTETGPSSEGCTENSCPVTSDEIEAGGAIVHLHNVVLDSRPGRISREFPGPGDPQVVRLGLRNGIRTPSNAVRVLDGTGGDVRLRTLQGRNAALNRYIERNWVPGMTSSEINDLATRYRGAYP